MKLARNDVLWVAELRGRAVFLRSGKSGGPGRLVTKAFESEAAASAWVDAERQQKLQEGYVQLTEHGRVDAPFVTGAPAPPVELPPLAEKYASAAEVLRACVLGGFEDDEVVDQRIATIVSYTFRPPATLAAQLARVVADARTERRRAVRPQPCINAGLDRAMAALDARAIIALQNAGARFGTSPHDAWADAELQRKRRPDTEGACVYGLAELVRAVRGEGLVLTCRAWPGRSVDVAEIAHATLLAEGVPSTRDGETVGISPFPWFRW